MKISIFKGQGRDPGNRGNHRNGAGIDLRSTTPRAEADSSSGIARLLGHRFGDGLIYIRDESERYLFHLAVERGLISPEGYLTPEGHSFLAAHGND